MYKIKTLCAVIPCYNEETQIEGVIQTMPDYVDVIVTVDDKSPDNTIAEIQDLMTRDKRIAHVNPAIKYSKFIS